jgi:hypothetical protein
MSAADARTAGTVQYSTVQYNAAATAIAAERAIMLLLHNRTACMGYTLCHSVEQQ